MSYYRKVDCRMHADEKFQELSDPQPCGKYLWVYLLTHKKQQIPGLIEVGKNALAEELKWATDGMLDAFREVKEHGMAHADWDARLVWMPKGILYNWPASINVVKSWGPLWDELPECDLKLQAWEAIKAALEPSKAFQVAFLKACPKPSLKASRMPKALPSPIHKHKHKHNTNLDLRIDVDLKTGQVPPPANEVDAAAEATEPRVVNGLELYGLVRAPEPDEVELCPRSATRSAPPPPESAATGQSEDWTRASPWYGFMETQPIRARCEWLLLQKHDESHFSSHKWPEVLEVWDVFLDAQYGQRHAKLTNWSSDCQAIVKLFAAGYDLETIRDTIPKCVSGNYFAHQRSKGQKPGMSTITPVVFARELPGKEHTVAPVRKPKIGEEGYRRQSDGGATIYDFMAPAEVSSG